MLHGNRTRQRVLFGLIVVTALGLGACGGGGGASGPGPSVPNPSPAPTPTPTPIPPADSPPVIAVQPQSQSAPALGAASFSVTSANASAYQWQKSTDDGATWTDVVDGTAATLSLPRVALVDGGMQVRVTLTNGNGTSISDAVKLTVKPNPRLLAGALGGAGFRDGPAVQARLHIPRAIAMDAAGNAYIADGGNHVIRRLSVDGTMSTFAGVPGLNGRTDGPAAQALFNLPRSVAIGPDGAIWSLDQGTCLLRKVAAGQVTTVADLGFGGCAYGVLSSFTGYEPADMTVGPSGDVYVSDLRRHVIWRVDTSGVVSVFAGVEAGQGHQDGPRLNAWFDTPRGLAFDAGGNLYVVDRSRTLRRIAPDGLVTTIAGQAGQVGHVDGVGAAARFVSPRGLAIIGTTLLVADSWIIRQVDLTTYAVTTVAGAYEEGFADGVGAAARFDGAVGIAASNANSSLVTDANNHMIRRVTAAGVVTRVAGERNQTGSTDAAGAAARFRANNHITADAAGSVYVAEGFAIRKVTPEGVVSIFAGAVDRRGTDVGIGAAARFVGARFIGAGADGNLYVADTDRNTQCGMRNIAPDGMAWWYGLPIYTCYQPNLFFGPGYFVYFAGLAVGTEGTLAFTDEWTCTIYKVVPGEIRSIAGGAPCNLIDGPAGAAMVSRPTAVAYEPSGALLFVDSATTVRRLKSDGGIETVAGATTAGYADGVGGEARFRSITALAVDASGRIYVVDSGNHSIRLIEGNKVRTLIPWNVGPRVVLGEGGSLNAPVGIALLPGGAVALTTEYGIVID